MFLAFVFLKWKFNSFYFIVNSYRIVPYLFVFVSYPLTLQPIPSLLPQELYPELQMLKNLASN